MHTQFLEFDENDRSKKTPKKWRNDVLKQISAWRVVSTASRINFSKVASGFSSRGFSGIGRKMFLDIVSCSRDICQAASRHSKKRKRERKEKKEKEKVQAASIRSAASYINVEAADKPRAGIKRTSLARCCKLLFPR